MKAFNQEPEVRDVVEVRWAERWQVYLRLRELEISCWCATNQPLQVHIADVTAAIQFWSVIRQLTAPRQDLVCALDRCWQLGA